MPEKLTRYCPNCGQRVVGDASVFESPRKCPKCNTFVLFEDPLEEPELELNAIDTLLNRNVRVFNIAAATALVILVGGVLLGGYTILAVIAACCLSIGIICFFFYLNQRASFAPLKERKDKFNQVLSKYAVLKKNFDAFARDETLRAETLVAEKIDKAEYRELQAEQRIKAVDALGKRFLKDTLKWTISRLTSQNFVASKERLLKVIGFCREAGYPVSNADESKRVSDLKAEYEMVLRRDFEKKEQARIKERIREEQRAEREYERELTKIEAQKKAIQKALEEALARVKDEHSAEVQDLKARLKEAEERSQRATAMAQMTRAGHVYVISNIGSFGLNLFKIGLTRRLEPLERVRELGDASVPFPFDVHMMIHSDDAVALESALHNEFDTLRVNKVNMRKEFFRVDLETIRKAVEREHGEVSYVADAEALQYRQSQDMSEEEYEYVSRTIREIEGEEPESILEH